MARSTGPNFEGLTICQPSPIDSSKMSTSMRKMKNWRRLEIYWKKWAQNGTLEYTLLYKIPVGPVTPSYATSFARRRLWFIVSKPL